MDKFTYLIYTHIDYDDILDIHLKRLHKYFPTAPCGAYARREGEAGAQEYIQKVSKLPSYLFNMK